MTNFFNLFTVKCDAPRPWGVYFQDSASPQMEALVELHDNIMFYLVIILFGVAWILVSIIRNYVYNKSPISNKYLNHGTLIELIWTITPALILILIAFPSFKLLYLMDEVTDPSLTVFVEGHQWYWSYQCPDFLGNHDEELEFYSYLAPGSDSSHIVSLSNNNAPAPVNIGNIPSLFGDCEHDLRDFYSNNDVNLVPVTCDAGTDSHKLFPIKSQFNPFTRQIERTITPRAVHCIKCNLAVCVDCATQVNLNTR